MAIKMLSHFNPVHLNTHLRSIPLCLPMTFIFKMAGEVII